VGFPKSRAEKEERRGAGTETLYKERRTEKTSTEDNTTTKNSKDIGKDKLNSKYKHHISVSKRYNYSSKHTVIKSNKSISHIENNSGIKTFTVPFTKEYKQKNPTHLHQDHKSAEEATKSNYNTNKGIDIRKDNCIKKQQPNNAIVKSNNDRFSHTHTRSTKPNSRKKAYRERTKGTITIDDSCKQKTLNDNDQSRQKEGNGNMMHKNLDMEDNDDKDMGSTGKAKEGNEEQKETIELTKVKYTRLPPLQNKEFWNNYELMYQTAINMEEEVSKLDQSDPKRPEIVQEGSQLVEQLQSHTKTSWVTLKEMVRDSRERFLQIKSNEPKQYSDIVTSPGANNPKRKRVRLRISFMGKQSKNRNQEKIYELKHLFREVLNIGKGVDAEMKIGSWTQEDVGVGLNEIVRLNEAKTLELIDIPSGTTMLKGMIRGVGIKLYTHIPVHTIVRLFSIVFYRSKGRNGMNLTVKEGESQLYPKSYPIGYLQGTSSNGDYRTIKEQLIKETNGKAEASWQNIYIRGVTRKIWDTANKEALKYGKKGTAEFKKRKF
jgi:hypothetical protein